MAAHDFDLVIIGAGSGGLTAAGFAAQLGAKVALVEKNRIGGDCTWTGCVPSKALLKAAKIAHEVRTATRFGISANPPIVEMAKVRAVCATGDSTGLSVREPGGPAEAGDRSDPGRRAIRRREHHRGGRTTRALEIVSARDRRPSSDPADCRT